MHQTPSPRSKSRSPSPKKLKTSDSLPPKLARRESGNAETEKTDKKAESGGSRSPTEETKKPAQRPKLLRNEVKVKQDSPEKTGERRSRKHSYHSSRRCVVALVCLLPAFLCLLLLCLVPVCFCLSS